MFETVAQIVGGYKAGQITAVEADRLLRAIGCDKDLAALLAVATGIGVGVVVGDLIDDIFDFF